MEGDLKEIRSKVFKIQTNTQEALAVINQKLDTMSDDLRSFSVSADKLKTEIQQIHIRNASMDVDAKKLNETYGKVIVLEGRLENISNATRSVISELRLRKTKEG